MTRTRALPALALLLAASWPGSARAADSPGTPDAAYIQSFEKWKAEQTADLEANWLPLVGLFWLKPGANTFGSDPANAVVFPKGPARAGEFDLAGKNVTLKLLPATQASIDGKRVRIAVLQPDTSDHPSLVSMGTLRFHVIVRGERVGIRVKDTDSESARKFKGMQFFPLNLDYRVTARWVPADGKQTIQIPNVLGDVIAEPVPGSVVFTLQGREFKLTALGGDPGKTLFFVFSDATARNDTYPGGRFLDTGPVSDGTVMLDFNRAYNPPCAVTPYATCPLAPRENRLPIAVPAGEKFDKAAHAHP
ncbi:MAG TPA: DUF1684 domain-containing protein [Candidatus Sulfotelmatobacter sp.]|nr:DUF1684 domain-containing protein [Candidatus Sulfotelmatobacter sp.]